jgi:endonuclease YncB( thermonuclease family)
MHRRFPLRRQQRRGGCLRTVLIILGLSFIISSAWFYAQKTDARETVDAADFIVLAADGDSFSIGNRKLRLKGIDAPERHQTCTDESGSVWACGQAAHGALVSHLAQPGIRCITEVSDRFGRALATCKSNKSADIAAEQVKSGLAITDDFHSIRSYGNEEDAARAAKIGIWQGSFVEPKEWRATHQRNGMPSR